MKKNYIFKFVLFLIPISALIFISASSGNFNVLGIAKEKQLDFAVYLNLSRDNINIQLPSGVSEANLNVFDISGRLVRSTKITSQNKLVNVTDLSSGIYILKIQSEGKTRTKQFIKG